MEDLITTFKEGWLDEDPRLVFATLAGIAVFITLTVMLSRAKKKLERIREAADADNSFITARIKSRHRNRNTNGYEYSGIYTYTIDGKVREYRALSHNPLDDTLRLYRKENGKVFSEYDEGLGPGVAGNAVAAIAVLILILWLTGYGRLPFR